MSALRSVSWASSNNDYISGYNRDYDYLIVHLETLVRCICVTCVSLPSLLYTYPVAPVHSISHFLHFSFTPGEE